MSFPFAVPRGFTLDKLFKLCLKKNLYFGKVLGRDPLLLFLFMAFEGQAPHFVPSSV